MVDFAPGTGVGLQMSAGWACSGREVTAVLPGAFICICMTHIGCLPKVWDGWACMCSPPRPTTRTLAYTSHIAMHIKRKAQIAK
jgi:hypothetical protein